MYDADETPILHQGQGGPHFNIPSSVARAIGHDTDEMRGATYGPHGVMATRSSPNGMITQSPVHNKYESSMTRGVGDGGGGDAAAGLNPEVYSNGPGEYIIGNENGPVYKSALADMPRAKGISLPSPAQTGASSSVTGTYSKTNMRAQDEFAPMEAGQGHFASSHLMNNISAQRGYSVRSTTSTGTAGGGFLGRSPTVGTDAGGGNSVYRGISVATGMSAASAYGGQQGKYSVSKRESTGGVEPNYDSLQNPAWLNSNRAAPSANTHLSRPRLPEQNFLSAAHLGATAKNSRYDRGSANTFALLDDDAVNFEESPVGMENPASAADAENSAAGELSRFLEAVASPAIKGMPRDLSGAPTAAEIALKKRLTRFYEQYDDTKIKNIPQMISKYNSADKQADLFAKLVDMYGPEPFHNEPKVPEVVLAVGKEKSLMAPSSASVLKDPLDLQEYLYESWVAEMERAGMPLPKMAPIPKRLKAIAHDPLEQETGGFVDPFYGLKWWEKGLDKSYVLKSADGITEEREVAGKAMYRDQFGRKTTGQLMVHPLRMWLVAYIKDQMHKPALSTDGKTSKKSSSSKPNKELVHNMDKWVLENLEDPFAFEKKIMEMHGPTYRLPPLASQYNVIYPASSGIKFTPMDFTPPEDADEPKEKSSKEKSKKSKKK